MLTVAKPFVVWAIYPAALDWLGGNHLLAALACLALIVLISHRNLRRGFLIDWTAVAYFAAVIVVDGLAGSPKVLDYPLILISATYTVVTAASLALGRPYTLQYARECTPEEFWNDEIFLAINRHLTLIWIGIFLASFVLSALAVLMPDQWPLFVIARNVMIAVGLVLPDQYPNFYLRRIGQTDA